MQSLNGFVKIHRKLIQWGWYQDYVVKDVFLHLLLTASFKDSNWRGQVIKSGQVVTSYKHLAEDLGFGVKQIRNALNKLKETHEVAIKTTNKFTVITIVNWEDFQNFDELGASKRASEWANKGQTKGKQGANKGQHRKNVKNVKECIEGSVVRACAQDDATDSESDDDYSAPHIWGGKMGKGVLVMSDKQFDELLEIMSVDVLHKYTEKITNYIISEGKTVRNHYATIKKWYNEDYGGKQNG